MTQTIGEDQVVVGVLTHREPPWRALLALPCLKLVGNGRRNENLADARFGLGLFQKRACSFCASSSAGRGRGRPFCSRDFMAVLSTRCSSFFSIIIDAVPAAMLCGEISTQSQVRPNFADSHTARKGRVDSQDGHHRKHQGEKNVSASQTSRFLGYSLRNRGMES